MPKKNQKKQNQFDGCPTLDASTSITIKILPQDAIDAVPQDGDYCAVAQAFKRTYGEHCQGISVGTTITKVLIGGTVYRYGTPSTIVPHLRTFDMNGGKWDLPEGEYTFKPPCKTAKIGARTNRWNVVSKRKLLPVEMFIKQGQSLLVLYREYLALIQRQ